MSEKENNGGERQPVLWVLVVIACGLIAGGLLWLVHPIAPGPGPGLPPAGGPAASGTLGRAAGVLSLVDLALLVSLIVVYVRTYRDTRAPFALGLVLFLVALVIESTSLSLPILAAFGFGWGGLGIFFLVSTIFETIALAVFLYLSLN